MRTLDPATRAGARALERLETDLAGWLTAVDTDGQPQTADGDEYVTMEGDTRVDPRVSPSSGNATYQAKDRHMIDRYGWTPEWVSEHYPLAIVVTPTRWRLPVEE